MNRTGPSIFCSVVYRVHHLAISLVGVLCACVSARVYANVLVRACVCVWVYVGGLNVSQLVCQCAGETLLHMCLLFPNRARHRG